MKQRLSQCLAKALNSLIALTLLGCSQISSVSNPTQLSYDSYLPANHPLNNTKWILQSIYGHPPLEGTTITLEFTKDYIDGNSSCNEYSAGRNIGNFEISDDGILKIVFAQTLLPCLSPTLMDQEEEYFKALRSVSGYQLNEAHLELRDETGNTILIFTK
jgi:heat shock protein HslJ